MEIINADYSGPSFSDLSQAAQGAGITIPDNPVADSSMFSMDYWQQKAADFQTTLNAIDSGYKAAQLALNSPGLIAADPTLYDDLTNLLAEFDSKKTAMRLTAEAINGGAAVVNSLGGNFQSLNIPGTLGIAPIAFPVAAVGAFAVAATLITWGVTWLQGLNQRLARAQLLDALPPEAKAAASQAMITSDNALAEAQGTTFNTVANYVKWGGIALIAFLIYKSSKSGSLSKLLEFE
jgi:hypothetical protein